MARNKYGMQKPVQNDLQQCINSFERMKRDGIGIADELVCDTCKRALKYIDELETKLAESEPVRHGHWISAKAPITMYKCSKCSECGALVSGDDFNFCPNCGAKMDVGGKMTDKNTPWSKRAPFDPESITCGRCDSDISDRDFEFCPYCGQKLDWSCLSDTETSFEMDGKTYNVFFDDFDDDDDD